MSGTSMECCGLERTGEVTVSSHMPTVIRREATKDLLRLLFGGILNSRTREMRSNLLYKEL